MKTLRNTFNSIFPFAQVCARIHNPYANYASEEGIQFHVPIYIIIKIRIYSPSYRWSGSEILIPPSYLQPEIGELANRISRSRHYVF